MSFAAQAKVNELINELKSHLQKHSTSIMEAFHAVDVDRSQSLSATEFANTLASCGIKLPAHTLNALVARFDANGDGTVSMPEFQAFMTGATDNMDALRAAPKVPQEAEKPVPKPAARPMMASMMQSDLSRGGPSGAPADLTYMDRLFLSRMEQDLDSRRRTSFINEIKKDPRFKPSMLEPPKSKLQPVSLDGGPVIKTHKAWKTGLETKRPYQWGPLGGYY